ncbi:hypothetical protein BKA93DRAFT_770351 [Sparassis latifolia]
MIIGHPPLQTFEDIPHETCLSPDYLCTRRISHLSTSAFRQRRASLPFGSHHSRLPMGLYGDYPSSFPPSTSPFSNSHVAALRPVAFGTDLEAPFTNVRTSILCYIHLIHLRSLLPSDGEGSVSATAIGNVGAFTFFVPTMDENTTHHRAEQVSPCRRHAGTCGRAHPDAMRLAADTGPETHDQNASSAMQGRIADLVRAFGFVSLTRLARGVFSRATGEAAISCTTSISKSVCGGGSSAFRRCASRASSSRLRTETANVCSTLQPVCVRGLLGWRDAPVRGAAMCGCLRWGDAWICGRIRGSELQRCGYARRLGRGGRRHGRACVERGRAEQEGRR